VGVTLERGGEARQRIGERHVVVIEHPHVVAGDVLQAEIGGARLAHLGGGLEVENAGQERLDHGARGVGRAIVDHDDLRRREGLGEQALEALGEERRSIEGGDNDADPRVSGLQQTQAVLPLTLP
jgi:hypothetical protein